MKTAIYTLLGIIFIVLTSITSQSQTIDSTYSSVSLQAGSEQSAFCSGATDNIRIYITTPIAKSRTQTQSNTNGNGCEVASVTMGSCNEISWEGPNIVNKVTEDFNGPGMIILGQYTNCRGYIDVRPTTPGVYSYKIKHTAIIKTNESNCQSASIYKIIYYGQITISIGETAPTPTLVAQTKRNPADNTKEIMVLSVPQRPNLNVEWSVEGASGHELSITNPFDCQEYKARYISGNICPSEYSNSVIPGKAFKPTLNVGYSQVYSDFLQSKVNQAVNSPEYHFRWQFNCIQKKSRAEYNRTGENGWGGGFAKFLFNNMATDTPCDATVEKNCAENRSSFRCTVAIGSLHFMDQLKPNFFKYLPANPTISHDTWDTQHEAFLTNAVEACFNELFPSPTTNPLCLFDTGIGYSVCLENWVSRSLSKGFAVYQARVMREFAQQLTNADKVYSSLWENMSTHRKAFVATIPFPAPIDKQYLFSSDIENGSVLKVKSDTAFYLHINQTIQLAVTFTDTLGNVSDLTQNSTGTKYELDVDTTVATISSNGLLHIKSTSLPFINGRLPLKVFAANGSRIGIGQFAVMDTDSDNDLIVDSYETKLGLNPNVPNLGDADGDYLLDVYEVMLGSNPLIKDSDGDGFTDVIELQKNTNLTNADSFPVSIQSIASGAWNSTGTWSCNCIPSKFDAVIINEGHNIHVPNSLSVDCNTISIKQGAIFNAPATSILKVLNK